MITRLDGLGWDDIYAGWSSDACKHYWRRWRSQYPERALLVPGELPVPSASFDYVLCHLALMLVDDLDPVVRGVARVLVPGGCFAALLPDESGEHAVFGEFMACFEAVARSHPGRGPLALGDPRSFRMDQLSAVFHAAAPAGRLRWTPPPASSRWRWRCCCSNGSPPRPERRRSPENAPAPRPGGSG